MRYIVIPGSVSGHCCFEASVVDESSWVPFDSYEGGYYGHQVCECFDIADAYRIAEALNGCIDCRETS